MSDQAAQEVITKQIAEVMAPFQESLKQRDAEEQKWGEALGDTDKKLTELSEKLTELTSMKTRLDQVEAKMNQPGISPSTGPENKGLDSDDYKAVYWKAMVHSYEHLSSAEQKVIADLGGKVLSNAVDTTAGYLQTPPEFINEIIKPIDEFSAIRALARVRTTSTGSIQIPKRTGTFSATKVAEQGTRAETTGLTYGMFDIPVHEWYARVVATRQMIADAAFDIPAIIAEEARMQFIVAEGADFTNGNNVGGAQGFMDSADISSVNTEVAASFDSLDPFITCKHNVKSGYWQRAVWVGNRTSIGILRLVKGGDGHYLWEPSAQLANPDVFLGQKVVEVPDMPDVGAGTYPFCYGDFEAAYLIVDRTGLDIMRDPYSAKSAGAVEFDIFRRWGGRVIQPESLYKIKCAVT